ncbi:uncharacterized protein LOC119654405 [Hermetia illucens]|uniref:uncharacterized protein LOC119654405 n=1 Tax=Hermetia illucens TaxID=343691 RepID=UPI0018CC68AA|nr:uncharacterized protein LOC119654405 [Hermetia illucens]
MAQKGTNVFGIMKNIYNNEYQWAVVKSLAVFLVGVRIAQECIGMEIMPAIASQTA